MLFFFVSFRPHQPQKAAVDGLSGGPLLAVDLFNDRQLVLPKTGEQVTLAFPPHACWVSNEAKA